jgi:hypothetical protein
MICMLIEVHIKPSALDEFLEVIKHDAVHSEGDASTYCAITMTR